jgi:hypothetical protein
VTAFQLQCPQQWKKVSLLLQLALPSDNSFAQQLEIAVRQFVASALSEPRNLASQNDDKKLYASVKAEMTVFQSDGKRGRCLEQVCQYMILTVPPASLEAERAFSAAVVSPHESALSP